MTTQQPICVKGQHKLKIQPEIQATLHRNRLKFAARYPVFVWNQPKTASFCCVILHKVASDLLNLQLFHTLIGNGPKEVLQNPRFG